MWRPGLTNCGTCCPIESIPACEPCQQDRIPRYWEVELDGIIDGTDGNLFVGLTPYFVAGCQECDQLNGLYHFDLATTIPSEISIFGNHILTCAGIIHLDGVCPNTQNDHPNLGQPYYDTVTFGVMSWLGDGVQYRFGMQFSTSTGTTLGSESRPPTMGWTWDGVLKLDCFSPTEFTWTIPSGSRPCRRSSGSIKARPLPGPTIPV